MVKYATPPPPQQILYPSIIVKKNKINNADHFEFIIHAFEEDIPGFRFLYYHYDLFFMLVNVPGMPPPPCHTHTHNDEKYWIHVCLFPCKKEVRPVPPVRDVDILQYYDKLRHPSSRGCCYICSIININPTPVNFDMM